MTRLGRLSIPQRVLLGPGPSNVHPHVLQAMSTPLVGHLDPKFIELMDHTQELLRFVFQTHNRMTLPISGTGSAGMETCLANLIEPGDEVIIGVNGVFGTRMVEVAERCGARPFAMRTDWGRVFSRKQVQETLDRCRRPKFVALVHAETSTGAWQPLEELASLIHQAGALFVVDAVTSLGGCPLEVDNWGIDACYSGTQKCLSCPPGLSPVTFSQAALDVIGRRASRVQSWYLDLSLLGNYWSKGQARRVYHHTAPISMIYALCEALSLVKDEGLLARHARHRRNHEALAAGLKALGMELVAEEGHRLWMLNSVSVPDRIDEAAVRTTLLNDYNIEIGAGLGDFAGKVWRIGLMGESSSQENVLLLLESLEAVLGHHGHQRQPGDAARAARQVYAT